MKRKIELHWTCSDYAHHSHRWKWSAWLCGRIQYFFHRLGAKIWAIWMIVFWYIKFNFDISKVEQHAEQLLEDEKRRLEFFSRLYEGIEEYKMSRRKTKWES